MKHPSIIHADFNEVLFSDRNQAYGAYLIRKSSSRTLLNAFYITSATIISLVLFLYLMRTTPVTEQLGTIEYVKEVVLADIPPENQPKKEKVAVVPMKKKENTAPAKMKGMDTQEFIKPKPVADALINNSIATDSMLEDKQPGLVTTDTSSGTQLGGDPRGTAKEPTDNPPTVTPPGDGGKQLSDIPDPTEIHFGTMPVAVNMDEIRKQIGYPKLALEAEMEGKAIFRVLVDEFGNYMEHITLRASHPIFLKACEKKLKNIVFEPGKMGEQPVKVWVVIPFRFVLNR